MHVFKKTTVVERIKIIVKIFTISLVKMKIARLTAIDRVDQSIDLLFNEVLAVMLFIATFYNNVMRDKIDHDQRFSRYYGVQTNFVMSLEKYPTM